MKNKLLLKGLVILGLFCFVVVPAANASNISDDPAMAQMQKMQEQQRQMQQQIIDSQTKLMEMKHASMEPDAGYEPDQDSNYWRYHGKSLRWVRAYDGEIPYRALIAGYDQGEPLYICHTNYRDGVEVGQLVEDGCLLSYAGRAFVIPHYQVLTGRNRTFWLPSSKFMLSGENDNLQFHFTDFEYMKPGPKSHAYPFKGGIEPQRTLYICRAQYGNSLHVGKLVAGYCNIGVNDTEQLVPTYEILFAY